MKKSTFESLPNELLLIIFGYLSSIDLYQTFFHVKNVRIEHLLSSLCHSLDVSSMHYNQLRQFLSNVSNDTTKRFINLIDTLVLHGSPACAELFLHWTKTLNDTELFNTLLPSIKQLILNADYYGYSLIEPLLTSLVCQYNTLRRVHLIFKRPTNRYSSILSELICYRISVHTMILEVEKGHEIYPSDRIEDLHKMQPVCWPNTVKLTLSIQHSSELMLLFQRGVLPAIEHLSVTNEEIRTVLPSYPQKLIPNIQLSEHDLRQSVDGTRLRSLLLRYMTLNDIVILMSSLPMPLLEKRILVDLYDHTLDHLDKFQELCGRTYLPCMKHLYFSFCFPQEMEHTWRISPFSYNDEWPFDNIGYYIDETLFFVDNGPSVVKKTLLTIYKRPINVLLQHKRTLHNHRFAAQASMPIIATQRRSLELTCDQIGDPDQVVKTLQVIASNRLEKLHLTYPHELIKTMTISKCFSGCDLWLHRLRSMTFDFKSKAMKGIERVSIVKQILDISPNLSHLEVGWKDFRHCSRTYSNLKHVHLILNRRLHPEPKQHLNVHRLAQLAPHLRCLETNGAVIMFNENLVEFVLQIIRRFHQLVYLTLNKNNLYKSKDEKKILFKERLIAASHGRLFSCNDIQIRFPQCDKLCIWL